MRLASSLRMRLDSSPRHRQSIRLKDYDYSSEAAYFVTICTQNRENLFGKIHQTEMMLNGVGAMVQQTWKELPVRFPEIRLDASVVMPNHFHGIVWIVPSSPIVGATPRGCPGGRSHVGIRRRGLGEAATPVLLANAQPPKYRYTPNDRLGGRADTGVCPYMG